MEEKKFEAQVKVFKAQLDRFEKQSDRFEGIRDTIVSDMEKQVQEAVTVFKIATEDFLTKLDTEIDKKIDIKIKELPCAKRDIEIKKIQKDIKRIDAKYRFFGQIFDVGYKTVQFCYKYKYQIASAIFLTIIFVACNHYHIL